MSDPLQPSPQGDEMSGQPRPVDDDMITTQRGLGFRRLRDERPYMRCPECSFNERATRIVVVKRRPFWRAATQVDADRKWRGAKCPNDGNTLVGPCEREGCGAPLIDPDDVCCRGCGRRYWWRPEAGGDYLSPATWQSGDGWLETIGRLSVYAVQAGIASVAADALVSTDNERGAMSSRSAQALKKKGGDIIEAESMAAKRELGRAWRTSAGTLPAQHVIHVALMDATGSTSATVIHEAVRNSLRVAEQYHAQSIAYPALGTGSSGFPMNESAAIARRALVEHVAEFAEGPLAAVGFALLISDEYSEFKRSYNAAM